MYVRICLSDYLFVCLCLSILIQLIIRKHMVVSIDGLLALLAAFLKKPTIFIISCIVPSLLFVENKFFFFFFCCVAERA